jgi:protein-S-isoprenylcysteine O-methyltransferase Ste14
MKVEQFGSRGEWWVVAQFFLLPVVLIGAVLLRATWPGPLDVAGKVLGGLCLLAALALALGGAVNLGSNLTVVPRPISNGALVQSGAYRIVRHPIYSGICFGALGWALLFNSLIGIILAGVVLLFFDQKSRREEVWLAQKYPEYAAYKRRVRKLIPFLY